MELLLIAGGVVVGLWCWGAVQRWAARPEPEDVVAEIRRRAKLE